MQTTKRLNVLVVGAVAHKVLLPLLIVLVIHCKTSFLFSLHVHCLLRQLWRCYELTGRHLDFMDEDSSKPGEDVYGNESPKTFRNVRRFLSRARECIPRLFCIVHYFP